MSKHKRPTNKRSTVRIVPTTVLSVIYPVYDQFDLLEMSLAALPSACGSVSYELILVDDGSTDKQFADRVFRAHPEAKILRSNTNQGFPKTCNAGARVATSPLLLFLNTDVVLHPNSVEVMVQAMDDPSVGIVGPKLLFSPDSPNGPPGSIQHAGMDTTIRGEMNHTFIGWPSDHPKANIRCPVTAISGACLMTRRQLFRKAGGFFEGYGKGTYEDCDLALTITSFGCTILYEPAAVGTHYVGASVLRREKQPDRYPIEQNRRIFELRHAGHLMWSEWRRL